MISPLVIRETPAERQPRKAVYCGKCHYDVRAIFSSVCPECGSELFEVGVRHRSREEVWTSWLASAYALIALVIPVLLILLLLRYACPSVVGEDYSGGAQYRLGVVPWEADPSVVIRYEGKPRKLVWRLPFGVTLLHAGKADDLSLQFVEPQGPAATAPQRTSEPILLHIGERGVEVVGQPDLTSLQIEDLFVGEMSKVSSLPPWEVQRAAEQLLSAIRRSATTDNRLWLLTMDRASPERATTYVWSLGFNDSQVYDHPIYWPMALAVILIPAAWWLLLGYVPRRFPRLQTAGSHLLY